MGDSQGRPEFLLLVVKKTAARELGQRETIRRDVQEKKDGSRATAHSGSELCKPQEERIEKVCNCATNSKGRHSQGKLDRPTELGHMPIFGRREDPTGEKTAGEVLMPSLQGKMETWRLAGSHAFAKSSEENRCAGYPGPFFGVYPEKGTERKSTGNSGGRVVIRRLKKRKF